MFYLIFNVFIITLFLSLGHYFACIGMLGKKWKTSIFLAYFLPMFVIQSAENSFLLFFTDFFSGSTDLFLLKEILLNMIFSFYAIWLAFLIYKKNKVPFFQSLFTSSIGYFIVISITFCTEQFFLNTSIFNFETLSDLELILLYSALPYAIGMVFGIFFGILFQKISFYQFLPSFFSTGFRRFFAILLSILLINPSIFLNHLFISQVNSSIYLVYSGLFVFAILLSILVLGIILQTHQKLHLQQALLSQQTAYMEAMKDLHTEMRTFRHDFHNLMAGIGVHISEENIAGVKDFMENMSIYFDERIGEELKYWESLLNLEHVLLKNLLAVKLLEMQQAGIRIILEIPKPIHTISMSDEDLLRCMGVFLDNAKEATEQLHNGLIEISLIQEAREVKIAVSNTFEGEPKLTNLLKAGYSTKGANRGTGLLSSRSIIKRYDHVVGRTLCENGFFMQELRIFNR